MCKVPEIINYHCHSCNFDVGIPAQPDMLDAYCCINCGNTIEVVA